MLIVGDSAGANLAVALAMKVAAEGVRKPDGILSIYGCLMIHYVPSASRILALMDPLLPIGILSLCLHGEAAYTTILHVMLFLVLNLKLSIMLTSYSFTTSNLMLPAPLHPRKITSY